VSPFTVRLPPITVLPLTSRLVNVPTLVIFGCAFVVTVPAVVALVALVAVAALVANVALATVPVTLPPVIEPSPDPLPLILPPVILPLVLMGFEPNAAKLAATLALPYVAGKPVSCDPLPRK
jgi:hypothetical protein